MKDKIATLKDRAVMLSRAREFFAQRSVMEVDCPALSPMSSVDAFIDVMKVEGMGYLHTSPEYRMKRLIADGIGDIYQMSYVYRHEEIGPLHNPEFIMVEWYRMQMDYSALIEETLNFIRLFIGKDSPSTYITYRQALQKFAGIDYLAASNADLVACAKRHGLEVDKSAERWDKDTLLQLIMSFVVEPNFGKEGLCVLDHYPASQAALSKTFIKEGEGVAERFEVYYKGIELANGYHELTDPIEQKKRLVEANEKRLEIGKKTLPIDESLITALEKGLPDCCGVAVGFDRLLMLRQGKSTLQEVLPFPWQ